MEYCQKKMKRFLEQDALLRFAVKDLIKRGHEEELALQVVFNSYVRDDSEMEAIYESF